MARLIPPMTPEQAQFLNNYTCQVFAGEAETTKRVIGSMTAGQENYKPSEKCMSAIDLAFHIASSDVWLLNSIADGAFGAPPSGDKPKTAEEVVAFYDANLPKALDRLKAMTPEQAANPIDFFGVMKLPAAALVDFTLRHSVHHRGQLSSYLRPMGGKVPGIYGPSGDTPSK